MIEPAIAPDVTLEQFTAMNTMLTPSVIDFTPTEGQTITVPASGRKEVFINILTSTTLNNLTIVLPNDIIGQRNFIGAKGTVANLVVTSAIPVSNGNIMLSPGDNTVFARNRSDQISRVLTS